jgi:hypothetical protein
MAPEPLRCYVLKSFDGLAVKSISSGRLVTERKNMYLFADVMLLITLYLTELSACLAMVA